MAQSAWPFENVDTSETQFSQWARNIGEGVKGSSAGTELKVFADSTGLQVKVPLGFAMVRGHYYHSTAQEILAISAAHPTLPRIDSVVLELDPSGNTILLKVIAGTAASTPSAPALTSTDAGIYQIRLANVAVAAAATSIASGNVTDTRTFLGATSIAWDAVTGKPTTFPPSAHTQNASTIITTSSDKSANYTLVAADENTFIRSTGSAITITVPDVLAEGESVNFIQAGAGQITFAGSGITLNSADALLKTSKQFAGATVVKSGGAYYLIGNLG